MKQKFILALIIASVPFTLSAQLGGLMNKVNNKLKSKIDQRIDTKVDKAIDKSLDEAEGKKTASGPAASAAGKGSKAATDKSALKSFSKYDFIPGEHILYYENFEQEAIAELPTGWNTNGSGEIVTMDNFPGKWMRVHAPFIYLSSNQKAFSENYTVEFDIIMQLKNNGWMYPTFTCGLISSKDESATDNSLLKDYNKYTSVLATIYPAEYSTSKVKIESFTNGKSYFSSDSKIYEDLDKYYSRPVHVAIQVQKERFRIWINESKLFDLPKAVPLSNVMNQVVFEVGSTNYKDNQYAMYLSNIKTATGKADTRHKLIDEGKFSTTAILFDVNSANIKAESAGVLKEIAGVIKEHKDIKIKIIGHTDSDGSDAANQSLSQKRAAAIKEALSKDYGIDGSKIETDGKGESAPVADNKSPEGKAANRRVEFIKQ